MNTLSQETKRDLGRYQAYLSQSLRDDVALIVDDDPEYRTMLKLFLRRLQIPSIHEADCGRKALKQIRIAKKKPGIVFLDVNMPFDGFECGKVLRSDTLLSRQDFFLVVSTTGVEGRVETQRFHSGFNYALEKPLTFEAVFQTVLVYLQHRQERVRRLKIA